MSTCRHCGQTAHEWYFDCDEYRRAVDDADRAAIEFARYALHGRLPIEMQGDTSASANQTRKRVAEDAAQRYVGLMLLAESMRNELKAATS